MAVAQALLLLVTEAPERSVFLAVPEQQELASQEPQIVDSLP